MIHCIETRLGQYSNIYVPGSFEQGVRFRFSSMQLDKSSSNQDLQKKDRSSNHSDTHMANSALVCTNSKNVYISTIPSASRKKFINKFTEENPSSCRSKVTENSDVEVSTKVCKWKEFQSYLTFRNKKLNN